MEEKTGKADKKEIRSRKNQKLYRSRFGKGGKIMKKLEIVIRPESLENLELLLEEQKANGMMITNILGYGNQKGYRQMYRGAEIVAKMLPKVKVETVVEDVWHSPHPPFFTVFCKLFVFKVLMCFMAHSSFIVVDARLFYSLRPLALSIIA